jgi:four helix bundle protein
MRIEEHRDLKVYRRAFEAAVGLYDLSESFPRKEMFSLTDQMRRSSRSVCANMAEAWRRRRYEAASISKLNDAETEAGETQVWIEFAVRHRFLQPETGEKMFQEYNEIISMIVKMINNPQDWVLKPRPKSGP